MLSCCDVHAKVAQQRNLLIYIGFLFLVERGTYFANILHILETKNFCLEREVEVAKKRKTSSTAQQLNIATTQNKQTKYITLKRETKMAKQLRQTDTGIWLEEEAPFEKRDKMTLDEWRAYYAQLEITEEEYLEMCLKYQRPLDA